MNKLAFVALLGIFGSSAFGQLVTNGGFETGDLTGWTVTFAGSFSGVEDGSPVGGAPHSGNYDYYFGATSAAGAEAFYQDVATTVGTAYTVSFWAEDIYPGNTDTEAGLTVTFGSNTVFNGIPPSGTTAATYTEYSGTFTATSTSTALSVAGWESADYIDVDDFSVVPASPEPASFAALGLGVLALIARRRR